MHTKSYIIFYLLMFSLCMTKLSCKKDMPLEGDIIEGLYIMYFDGYSFSYRDSLYTVDKRGTSGYNVIVQKLGDRYQLFSLTENFGTDNAGRFIRIRERDVRYFNSPFRNIRLVNLPLQNYSVPSSIWSLDSLTIYFHASAVTNFKYKQSFTGKAFEFSRVAVKYKSGNSIISDVTDTLITYHIRMEKYQTLEETQKTHRFIIE